MTWEDLMTEKRYSDDREDRDRQAHFYVNTGRHIHYIRLYLAALVLGASYAQLAAILAKAQRALLADYYASARLRTEEREE
jgi:hypothetical protein